MASTFCAVPILAHSGASLARTPAIMVTAARLLQHVRVEVTSGLFLRFCIQYSTIALLWYDYALTWTREVQYFWTKRVTLSTVLLPTMRYLDYRLFARLHCRISDLCDPGRFGSGRHYQSYDEPAVWGSRAYAVFNRSKIILVVFGSLELVVIGLSIVRTIIFFLSASIRGGLKSFPSMSAPCAICFVYYLHEKGTMLANILSVSVERTLIWVPDSAVSSRHFHAVLTSARSIQALNRSGSWRTQQKSLTFLVLREVLNPWASLGYAIDISCSGRHREFFLFSPPSGYSRVRPHHSLKRGTFFPRLMNAYALPLSGLMTARFLLNLREWDHRMTNPESDEWDIPGGGGGGGGGHRSAGGIQFRKSEPRSTRWTINDVLGDDPLLKPVETESIGDQEEGPSGGSSRSRSGE
ncbi:hypothetical protein M413DRAFT_419912 [Hebeloma cylindrosporum]|uniref:DUF6533 domain-containing protein n=1 Tax=Hebeloma cylindrosporum TaxID=76867 RepID=A0A0C3BQK4_HEBCY|nr:hypothetical protein M413DRAFT_419912 [Hebeloma cylindrosporum h7]